MNSRNWYFLLFSIILILAAALMYVQFHGYKNEQRIKVFPLEMDRTITSAQILDNAIWLIGDSRAKMWDASALTPHDSIRMLNLGIGGQSSAQVTGRFRAYLESAMPRLVILQAGINDLKTIGLFPDDSVSLNCTRQLTSLINLCKQNKIPVVVTSIFPVGKIEMARRLIWDPRTENEIINVNTGLRRECNNGSVVYFDAYSLLVAEDGKIKQRYEKDFLHVNPEGYQHLNTHLKPVIHQLLLADN